ncbi:MULTISPECIES: class I adenylate-forming enzyme family protein [unclassified Hyphomonas]|mgnify:FL=1|jgi:long-chain acyl-CoA synthetase|uniref:class I adenylate-forming enzyme family protein n=1 Tax=unclassified Hyphomonas TaxID=2630699 RepID=UPI000C966EFF|nr:MULTISPECIES: class I adenylate-forming enzyme family protein [unclassified Hyphomonas]MAL44418.1 AMP-dependent synthetase [Hyphomonas sp.]HBN94197.1 AMP-dependent synthetase [Hyphomonas sp.]HBX94758.1 AMP-dependent synthetase [Hyphomonas sp.]HBX98663.1 AMP-dependent synthetase [Hyphomonas sp.]HCE22019.1 AMP-dependent synthetase [Hyphomonas sp.]|tara:strand:- start:9530 stop:11233 length:1704 start_codon:yes stop_codon:yes gene_type:complete
MHYTELLKAREELTGPGGEFEIVEAEVLGNRLRVYKNAPPSVREVWLSTLQFPERDYLVYQDERWTYADAHRDVASAAAWMFDQGVKPGDRVAIAMRNYPEWMLLYWACVSVGIAVVGMNAWWTPEEMEYALKDSEPKILFADSERLERVLAISGAADKMKIVGVRAPDAPSPVIQWSDVLAHGGALPDVSVDPDADACIFYTSGTTGFPKGAQLTHRGCVSNLLNMAFAGASTQLATARATGEMPPEEAPVPVGLITTPLFHVTANNCAAYLITAAGGKIVLMYRWDAGEALKLVEIEKVTAMSGVPIMARELINHPDFEKTDTSSLATLGGGGAQLPPDLVQKIDSTVATARPNTGYGMTETCGIITSVAADFFIDKPDSAGPAMPNFEAKCVNDLGETVAQGEVGELWVRGSSVIKGYINRPEATAESITDGWLHTGDIARIDEHGFIFIVDRKKDMVLRGGENVYCAEVEAAIYRHPSVAECSVFGVPDDRLGEEVGVAVVLKPGEDLAAVTLREHCAGIMAKHKVPRYVWFLTALPRNASGKFIKRDLKEQLTKELDSAAAN